MNEIEVPPNQQILKTSGDPLQLLDAFNRLDLFKGTKSISYSNLNKQKESAAIR